MFQDDSLNELFSQLPRLQFSKCVRPSAASRKAARQVFFQAGTRPVFAYPKLAELDFANIDTQLQEVEKLLTADQGPAPLKKLYHAKLVEYKLRVELLRAITRGDDLTVSTLSQKLYGQPPQDLAAFEDEFNARLQALKTGQAHHHKKTVDAAKFIELVRAALEHYRIQTTQIKLSVRRRIHCSVSKHGELIIRVPKKLLISKQRARRLIAHEIEVHALRRTNGATSQLHILNHGTAGYLKTEEGLALYHQNSETESQTQVPGFWDAWATTLMSIQGFAAAFVRLETAKLELLQTQANPRAKQLARSHAWNLCVRASRGITKPGAAGVGYFRDHIYRQGFLEITQALKSANTSETLQLLFSGKVGLQDLVELKALNFEPGKLPDNISRAVVNTKKSR